MAPKYMNFFKNIVIRITISIFVNRC